MKCIYKLGLKVCVFLSNSKLFYVLHTYVTNAEAENLHIHATNILIHDLMSLNRNLR